MHLHASSAVLFGTLAAVLVACSSASDPTASSAGAISAGDDSPNDGSSSPTGGPKTPAAATSSGQGPAPAPTKATSAPNTAQCAATANQDDCGNCCFGPQGASLDVQFKAFSQCACNAAKTSCPAECANDFCNPDQPDSTNPPPDGSSSSGDACGSCEPDLDSCEAQAEKACAADPTCAAAQKCWDDAKCDSKPGGPDNAGGPDEPVPPAGDDGQ
jgi:hypothetical protein